MRELRAELGRTILRKASRSLRQGSWRCMPKRGRILNYTGQVASYNSCKDSMTGERPHAIPEYNWRLTLIHASKCVRGHMCSLSAQMCPFQHISRMCFVPRDEVQNQIPNIQVADVGGEWGLVQTLHLGRVPWNGKGGQGLWVVEWMMKARGVLLYFPCRSNHGWADRPYNTHSIFWLECHSCCNCQPTPCVSRTLRMFNQFWGSCCNKSGCIG